VLWCGLYRASRQSLFQDVLRITGQTDVHGRFVLKQGPIDLQRLSCNGPVGGTAVDAALAIVLGGMHSTVPDRPRMSQAEHSITRQLRQVCKTYLGNIARERRQWQLDQKRNKHRRDPSRLDCWLLRATQGHTNTRTASATTRRQHPHSRRAHPTPVKRRVTRLVCQSNTPLHGREVAAQQQQRASVRRHGSQQADDGRQSSILRYASLTTHT